MAEYLTVANALIGLAALVVTTIVGYFIYEFFRFKGPRARLKGRIPIDKSQVKKLVNEILVPVLQKEIHISGSKKRTFRADGPSFKLRFDVISDRSQLNYYHSSNLSWIVPIYSNGIVQEVACLTPDCLYVYDGRAGYYDFDFKHLLEEVVKELQLNDHLIALAKDNSADDGYERNHQVLVEEFGTRQTSIIELLTEAIINSTVRKQVKVTMRNGSVQTPLRSHGFHVHIMARPQDLPLTKAGRSTLNGVMLSEPEGAYGSVSGKGDLIFDDYGRLIGELIGDNLYFFDCVVRHGTCQEASYYAQALVKVREQIHQESIGFESKAEAFARICHSLTEKGTKSDTEQAEAQEQLQTLIKKAICHEQQMFHMESNSDLEAGKEFDALVSMDKVIDVKVTEQAIVVTTKTLYCQHPVSREYHEIGAFDIIMYPQNGGIQWKNRTRLVNGGNGSMNAPHVNSDGNACFGNTAELFPKLISSRDFATAALMAIAFVESINIDDSWGKHLGNWPVGLPPQKRGGK